jgi:sensor histidine kinase YesM
MGGLMLYGMIAGLAHATTTSRRLREREAAAARAELIALRAQLDPHFLFNTLHSIGGLIRQDPAAAEEAVERFGELMRYVLETGRSGLVALEEELSFVRKYLALESLRLGARLRVSEAIDEECLDCGVPPLLLQPLAENAIRHGVAPKRDGGTLLLVGAIEEDMLHLTVSDDGSGGDSAAIAHANGLGLAITRRQIAAHFGDAARMTVETGPDRGFSVRLFLPIAAPRAVRPL